MWTWRRRAKRRRPELALATFLEFGLKWAKELDGRPARIEVRAPRPARRPGRTAGRPRTPVITRSRSCLPYARPFAVSKSTRVGERMPGLMESPGMSSRSPSGLRGRGRHVLRRAALGPADERGPPRRRERAGAARHATCLRARAGWARVRPLVLRLPPRLRAAARRRRHRPHGDARARRDLRTRSTSCRSLTWTRGRTMGCRGGTGGVSAGRAI